MSRFLRAALAGLCIVLLLTSCDSAVAPDAQPIGVAFFGANGDEAARYTVEGGAQGRLETRVGLTTRYDVRVIDSEGDLLDIDGAVFSVRQPRIVISLGGTITVEGPDVVAIRGLQSLNTSVTMQLFRNDSEEIFIRDVPLSVRP